MPRGVPREFHTPAYRQFAAALRAMRKAAGLTQVELAARLKQPQAFVSKIEVAERRVDVLEWLAFCRACRTSPAKFLAGLPGARGDAKAEG